METPFLGLCGTEEQATLQPWKYALSQILLYTATRIYKIKDIIYHLSIDLVMILKKMFQKYLG